MILNYTLRFILPVLVVGEAVLWSVNEDLHSDVHLSLE